MEKEGLRVLKKSLKTTALSNIFFVLSSIAKLGIYSIHSGYRYIKLKITIFILLWILIITKNDVNRKTFEAEMNVRKKPMLFITSNIDFPK